MIQIETIAGNWDINLVGFADLSPAFDQLTAQGGAVLGKYPRAVSLGLSLSHGVTDAIADHGNRALVMNYIHHVYSVVNQRLDQAAVSVAGFLEKQGFSAFPVPASQVISFKTLTGLAPHKTAAHLSGLGWVGKSALLVTRKNGPRVRFSTVYTDAPLDTGAPGKNHCGKCRICEEACPAGAITGNLFEKEKPRGHIFDAGACNAYMKERRLELMGKNVFGGNCGLCVQVCPFGNPTSTT